MRVSLGWRAFLQAGYSARAPSIRTLLTLVVIPVLYYAARMRLTNAATEQTHAD